VRLFAPAPRELEAHTAFAYPVTEIRHPPSLSNPQVAKRISSTISARERQLVSLLDKAALLPSGRRYSTLMSDDHRTGP